MSATVFYNSSAELATCSNVFSGSGAPADPTAVTLVITDPAGVTTTYNWPSGPNLLTRTGPGAFTQGVPCSSAVDGIWVGVWTGTGAASDVAPFTWTVQSPDLSRYYCSLEELKSRLKITTTADDFEVTMAVAAASRGVDGYTERYFFRAQDTRTYVPQDLYRCKIDDLVSVTALATDPAGSTPQGGTFPVPWQASDFQLLPYNPGRTGEPWPFTAIRAVGHLTFPWVVPMLLMRMDRVQVSGVFGWPAVPQAVRTVTLILASQLFRMKDVPLGSDTPGEFAIGLISSTPVLGEMLGPYVRTPVLMA